MRKSCDVFVAIDPPSMSPLFNPHNKRTSQYADAGILGNIMINTTDASFRGQISAISMQFLVTPELQGIIAGAPLNNSAAGVS